MVNNWLAESETHLAAWRAAILDAVGNHGQILIDIIPADVYFGREKEIIKKRNKLKEQSLALRRQQYLQIVGV